MAENNENDDATAALCDESKCVSRGLSATHFSNSFTCYGDETGEFYPMMCADGYQPRVVDSVPTKLDCFPPILDSITVRDVDGCEEETKESGDGNIEGNWNESVSLRYHTCCPPNRSLEELTESLHRHCSDPITNPVTETTEATTDNKIANENSLLLPCTNGTVPREMKTSRTNEIYGERMLQVDSYMCCNPTTIKDPNLIANFLNENDVCVPYHDEHYTELKVINSFGTIQEITCGDISNSNGSDSWFPRPITIKWNHTYDCKQPSAYECCKTGPAMQPFVEDSAFYKTVYPQLVISSIAAISCIILILALCLPILWSSERENLRGMSARGSSLSFTAERNSAPRSSSRFSVQSRTSEVGSRPSKYSTYNLYLVYLAIPDLLYCLYIISAYGSYANNNAERYNSKFSGAVEFPFGIDVSARVVSTTYSLANLYLNALVSWEVLVLLRNSHRFRKVKPPSLLKVTQQALAVYGIAAVAFVVFYVLMEAMYRAEEREDYELFRTLKLTCLILAFTFHILPFIGVVGVCFEIWRYGYMPSIPTGNRASRAVRSASRQDKALRELAFYFLRIIAVFFGIWIPYFIGLNMCVLDDYYYNRCTGFAISNLLSGIQPILSVGMALTKSDVKNYVSDLITLSCLRSVAVTTPADGSGALPASNNFTTREAIDESDALSESRDFTAAREAIAIGSN